MILFTCSEILEKKILNSFLVEGATERINNVGDWIKVYSEPVPILYPLKTPGDLWCLLACAGGIKWKLDAFVLSVEGLAVCPEGWIIISISKNALKWVQFHKNAWQGSFLLFLLSSNHLFWILLYFVNW